MKIAVIYKSKYGATKQYATWIAEDLGADLIEQSHIRPEKLSTYDMVIYGGGLYAGGIRGVDFVTKNPCNKLVIFTVGISDPTTTNYEEIMDRNIPVELKNKVKIFHLRGDIDYRNLSLVHRVMMAMMKKMTIDKKTKEEMSVEELAFTETYGKRANFVDKSSITQIIDYVRTL